MPDVSLEEFNGTVDNCLAVDDWGEEMLDKETTAFCQQV